MQVTAEARPITDIAADLGISADHVVPFGTDKAKIRLEALKPAERHGRLILVSAITPTKAGEGKTTTSIGLAQGLALRGARACLALREPSLGPTFGMKGGATGGGKSVVIPEADINLHFTGDFHAISSAHNLLAALIDNHIYHGNALHIDPRRIVWRRVVDLNDRSLRHVVIGLGGRFQGIPRETGFDITPASEIMAVLSLAENEEDMRRRLGRILVAATYDGGPITADQLHAVGPMMVLLRDAMMPNIVQTCEGVPAIVHAGPFANIAHGCNSVVGTKMALSYADWVVTEAGFGFDLGAEKFFDIKCRSAGLDTAAVVLVATVRALKRHGGVDETDLEKPDRAAVERGMSNLRKHVESIRTFGETPVVALNRFKSDTDDEIAAVRAACQSIDAPFAVADHFRLGGEGALELADVVVEHAEKRSVPFRPLYDLTDSVETKLKKIASLMYGAAHVSYSKQGLKQLERIEQLGYQNLPLCVAKTPASLTDDPTIIGRPEGFEITVSDFIIAAGAGYVVALLGNVLRMPGLPSSPQANRMDLIDGEIVGLR